MMRSIALQTLGVANSSYSYDAVGRLTNLEYQRGATTLASYGLVYDAVNRITQSFGTDGVQDYSYDSTNQLVSADHTTIADEAYSYDANGNRTNSGYGTGTDNRLLTDGVYNYTYDDEGNRTKRTEIATGKITEYVWDYRNRLTSVTFKDGVGVVTKTIEYLYDVDDRRIGKKIDGAVTERYVYDGLHIALAFDGAGVQTHRYLYGTEIDQILASETPTRVLWALTDRLGSVKDLVDENGVILNHINYDSYGRVVSQTNASVEFRYGYTGREQDTETGLDYYRARYYDASNGRFISEDPLGFGAGDGNLYRYVRNSPVNSTDPFGLRDMRWPFNGSVKNETTQPIYPLISNSKEDRYEILYSGDQTPDKPGLSKDVDGVWVLRNLRNEGKAWYFYPVTVDKSNIGGDIIVKEDRVVNGQGKRIQPWDPTKPDNNINSCPSYKDSQGKLIVSRGRDSARIPPDISKTYLDASKYIKPENVLNDPITDRGQSVERAIKAKKDQIRVDVKIKNDLINGILKIFNQFSK
jgi:RHS repeat-associated protein